MKKNIIIIIILFSIITKAFGQNIPQQTINDKKSIIELVYSNTYDKFNKTPTIVFDGVQGFCMDSENFYIALLSSDDSNFYTKQVTKILKINKKTKKIIAEKKLGQLGHSNSICYNNKNNVLYLAPCTKFMPYIYEVNPNLSINKIIRLKNNKNETYKQLKSISTLSYDPQKDEYLTKISYTKLACFDKNFKFAKTIDCSLHLKINEKMNAQAITTDGQKIYSVCNDLKTIPRTNYILVYDMNGKHQKTISFSKEIATDIEKIEFEQLACYNNEYYVLANYFKGKYREFRIYKINLSID